MVFCYHFQVSSVFWKIILFFGISSWREKGPVNCYFCSVLGTSAPQTTVQAQPPFVGAREKSLESWMIALLAVIGGLVFLVLICAIIACCCYRRGKKKEGILTVTSYSIGKAFVVCSYLGQHFNNFRLT